MPSRVLIGLLACATLLAGCATHQGSSQSEPAPSAAKTAVLVDNRGSLDMTIYVVDAGRRVRLGVAPSHATTELTIPPSVITGAGPLRFLCDPIGGARTPVSDDIMVQPGDTVTLLIPAN